MSSGVHGPHAAQFDLKWAGSVKRLMITDKCVHFLYEGSFYQTDDAEPENMSPHMFKYVFHIQPVIMFTCILQFTDQCESKNTNYNMATQQYMAEKSEHQGQKGVVVVYIGGNPQAQLPRFQLWRSCSPSGTRCTK